jgi:hypothetical protein
MTAKYLDRLAALQRAELYYDLHPRSPSAVRTPALSRRSGVWIALIGRSVRDGIAGFGPTVEAALRAFDDQYINSLRPKPEPGKMRPSGRRKKRLLMERVERAQLSRPSIPRAPDPIGP